MKFPGTNTVTMTSDSIRELLKSQAPTIFGDPSARITKIRTKSYPEGLEIDFTTDPDESTPRAPRSREIVETPQNCATLPRTEDDNPF